MSHPLYAPLKRLFCAAVMLASVSTAAAGPSSFAGTWALDRESSSAIDPWRRITLEITANGDELVIDRTVSTGRRTSSQAYPLKVGEAVAVPVAWWTGNRHIGAYMGGDGKETITTELLDEGRTLRLESRFVLASSQGETPVRSYAEYRLSPDGETLTVIELRSSRPLPTVHVYHRS